MRREAAQTGQKGAPTAVVGGQRPPFWAPDGSTTHEGSRPERDDLTPEPLRGVAGEEGPIRSGSSSSVEVAGGDLSGSTAQSFWSETG